MKKLLLLLCVSCLSVTCLAQKYYLGVGIGVNQHNGLLGLSGDFKLDDQYGVRVGAGIGTWGTKVGLGFLFKPNADGKWRFGLGYSSASGLKDFETEFEVNGGNSQVVLMDLNRQGLFNVTAIREFSFSNGNAFNIEFGYSTNISSSTFYTIKDGSQLDPVSIQVLRFLRPGGIVFGLSYLFRLNKDKYEEQ
ncbi:hypothetical protein [Chryseotalea sanaruensis]|uniref:hypothetical protein n=1 Tax=Chryseotalea sanaruensis TaxID=2482724 RepID=UPI000F8CB68F|nr:hypothetical protein [Chryseotalea sanaruensis]